MSNAAATRFFFTPLRRPRRKPDALWHGVFFEVWLELVQAFERIL